ncbi:MAG: hypothetical protein WD023_09240 [Ilumatobacteraceae bacterium]
MQRPRRHRAVLIGPLLTLLMVLVAAVAAPGAVARAEETEGLDVTSASRFVVGPTTGIVRATTDLTFTNTTIDETSDGVVRRRYFTGFTFPVATGATGESAVTDDGRSVTVTSSEIAGNTSFFMYAVQFPDPLFSGETLRLTVAYDITGLPPRSDDPSRVNPAYVAFTAYGVGDPGRASVEVVVPDDFVIDTFGSEATETDVDGSTIYTAEAIADPSTYALFVTARKDSALVSSRLTTPEGASFDIRGWPGDDAWRAFVGDQIGRGIPLLAQLVEQPWPLDDTVEIREAVTPYLYGYAGWFSATDAELEVGEDLDAEVVLHELSHAWFNTGWFADRWVNEGMAQVYSNAVVGMLGGTATVPTEPLPTDPAAIPLLTWGEPLLDTGADDTETYGYNAAHWVMEGVVQEIGFDGMATVTASVADRTIAYVGDAPAEAETRTTDWQRFLDLGEEVGGSTTIEPLMEQYVLQPADIALLADRATARLAYAQLRTDGGSWAPPIAVRRAMAAWTFDSATDQIEAAEAVLVQRDVLAQRSSTLGFALAADAESAYEGADDLAVVQQSVAATLDVADVVIEADVAANIGPGLIERLGLIGEHPDERVAEAKQALAAGDETAARAAAERAIEVIGDAGALGTTRALAAAGVLLATAGVAVVLVMVLRRRRLRPPTPDPSR